MLLVLKKWLSSCWKMIWVAIAMLKQTQNAYLLRALFHPFCLALSTLDMCLYSLLPVMVKHEIEVRW